MGHEQNKGQDTNEARSLNALRTAATTTIHQKLEHYLEALDKKRVNSRVQLLSRLGPEVYDDLLEYRLHLRTLQHQERRC